MTSLSGTIDFLSTPSTEMKALFSIMVTFLDFFFNCLTSTPEEFKYLRLTKIDDYVYNKNQ